MSENDNDKASEGTENNGSKDNGSENNSNENKTNSENQPANTVKAPGSGGNNLLFLSAIVLLIAGLVGFILALKPEQAPKASTTDPVWSEYISAHSKGALSKNDRIRVRFMNDVVKSDQVNKSAKRFVEISPELNARIKFINPREIEIKPHKQLKSGQAYSVTINTAGLLNIPKKLGQYTFQVNTIKQDYEIKLHGLQAQAQQKNLMVLSGSLITADVQKNSDVENVLSATHKNKSLVISWEHNEDKKHHEFTLEGVKRGVTSSEIELSWNGEAIGVSTQGKRQVIVPATGVFKVTYAKVIYGTSQKIEVRFSDKLKPQQKIKDLVELGNQSFTAKIKGNVLTLYPKNSLTGDVQLNINSHILNGQGDKLGGKFSTRLVFTSQKPKVKFSGRGVILPENKFLAIPIETINVHSVQVTAFRIYEKNIGQFLQSNKLDGNSELTRVGRFIWRKTIQLKDPEPERWNRYSIDATDLLKRHPGGLFRLTLSINRGNSIYTCTEEENNVPVRKEAPLANYEDLYTKQNSGWDFAEDYYGNNNRINWRDRNDPCKDAYYEYADGVKSIRNYMASNIGLMAKRDKTGALHLITTDLRTSEPLPGVKLSVFNFQNELIGTQHSDGKGFAKLKKLQTPFYAKASVGKQVGYLKLSAGTAIPTSHFDVGGHQLQNGVKGYVYGERGVWRPGDKIHLTFVLEDKQKLLPAKHPVSMSLIDPKGQMVSTQKNTHPVGKFYQFTFKTDAQAPTGNWTARAKLGGRMFSKKLKIETVIPNRLKMELQLPSEVIEAAEGTIEGKLFAQWLHGATASGLKADIGVRFSPTKTRFGRFQDFIFDDPARELRGDSIVFAEGELDDKGYMSFNKELKTRSDAPGMLAAYFTTRVFEESGAFSIGVSRFTYHPFSDYVGIKLPKGDQTRGMLLTDTDHTVEIATLGADGEPVAVDAVEVSLYKIHWRWWWEKGSDSLVRYSRASQHQRLQHGTISTNKEGRGQWTLNVKYPQWGRYLVRACDVLGKHCTGKVVYIDWPGWAGRAQEQSGPGASVLNLMSDKVDYQVGDKATITLPEASQGRALLTLETGSHILQQRWLQVKKGKTSFELPITSKMAPNVYVSVALIQPHQGKKNDRPIRLYGVLPIKVTDPQTKLSPVIKAADEWAPNSKVSVTISEKQGRPMTYTLAMVDEGLLGLTNFKTPDLHKHFYKKEALGVTTWDLFDQVLNAYGGELERMLALGGGEDGADKDSKEKRRFPPVVQFFGPFQLDAKAKKIHNINLPGYIGAVRLMLVAADKSAYGSSDKSVFVRQPLMVLPTAPRVIGTDESFALPVSVFVNDERIKQVDLNVETDDYFSIQGGAKVQLNFSQTGDKIGFIQLKSASKIGQGKIKVSVQSGKHQAQAEINLLVRAANPATTRHELKQLKPGEQWSYQLVPHGMENTNEITMEVSSLPPLNLSGRLKYLVRYPYGCLEQVTSSVFPQLYLPNVVHLSETEKKQVDNHIHAGIEKIVRFQYADGSFYYWPGSSRYNSWANSYAGHFLLEAEKRGYFIPNNMLDKWRQIQTQRAVGWTTGDRHSALDQAYRLYTLALANHAELGAMNRLRESSSLNNTARWYLAAAYHLSGQVAAAEELVNGLALEFADYERSNPSFGSAVRDKAIALNTLVLLGRDEQALKLIKQLSHSLSSDRWYSTQSVAFALTSIGQYLGGNADSKPLSLMSQWGSGPEQKLTWTQPIFNKPLQGVSQTGTTLKLSNDNQRKLFVTLNMTGIPKSGDETAYAKGLALEVDYFDADDNKIPFEKLTQGTDAKIQVRVSNTSGHKLENLALSHILPAGWEIKNERMSGSDEVIVANSQMDYRDIRDDRVNTFFGLDTNEEKTFTIVINAAYAGKYYLPGIKVEDMYDDATQARNKGQWIEVVR